MDYIVVIAIAPVVFLSWFLIRRQQRQKLPPGPYPFPIIGNIFQLGRQPHRSLANMSKTYGPLMSVKLGSIYTVIVTSPDVAKLVLRENDQAFSGKSIPASADVHGMDMFSPALMPIGEKWRKIRKLMSEQIFSARRLDAGAGQRREKLRKMIDYVNGCSITGRAVNVGEMTFQTALDLLWVTLFSVDFVELNSDATKEFKEIFEGLIKTLDAPNVADLFPFLKRFDPQRIKRRAQFFIGKSLALFQGLIDKRLESRSLTTTIQNENDLLDRLLDSVDGSNQYDLSMRDVQQVFLETFSGGTHSTQVAVEWAMTELLINPEKMVNAKNELRKVIGVNKQVEESDISRLPYLRALIKETLRLHPPAPLLFPRMSTREVEIKGYKIPLNTQVFTNLWAIGRDSSIWENPNLFEPERFLEKKIEFKGNDFEYIPFGSGRRMCPGMALADRVLHLIVGSLIHEFDWKVEEREEIDTREEMGLALHKGVPLKAIPVKV